MTQTGTQIEWLKTNVGWEIGTRKENVRICQLRGVWTESKTIHTRVIVKGMRTHICCVPKKWTNTFFQSAE